MIGFSLAALLNALPVVVAAYAVRALAAVGRRFPRLRLPSTGLSPSLSRTAGRKKVPLESSPKDAGVSEPKARALSVSGKAAPTLQDLIKARYDKRIKRWKARGLAPKDSKEWQDLVKSATKEMDTLDEKIKDWKSRSYKDAGITARNHNKKQENVKAINERRRDAKVRSLTKRRDSFLRVLTELATAGGISVEELQKLALEQEKEQQSADGQENNNEKSENEKEKHAGQDADVHDEESLAIGGVNADGDTPSETVPPEEEQEKVAAVIPEEDDTLEDGTDPEPENIEEGDDQSLDGPSPDSDIDEDELLRHAFSQEDKDTAERNLEPGMSVDYRDSGPYWVNSINGDGTVELYSGPATQAYASVPAEDCTIKSDYSLQESFLADLDSAVKAWSGNVAKNSEDIGAGKYDASTALESRKKRESLLTTLKHRSHWLWLKESDKIAVRKGLDRLTSLNSVLINIEESGRGLSSILEDGLHEWSREIGEIDKNRTAFSDEELARRRNDRKDFIEALDGMISGIPDGEVKEDAVRSLEGFRRLDTSITRAEEGMDLTKTPAAGEIPETMLRYKLKNGVVSSVGDYDKAMSDALLLLVNGRMTEAEFSGLAKSKGKEAWAENFRDNPSVAINKWINNGYIMENPDYGKDEKVSTAHLSRRADVFSEEKSTDTDLAAREKAADTREKALRDTVSGIIKESGIDVVYDKKACQEALRAMRKLDDTRYQRVYHGTGADFDRFDHRHMGEGEGAQAHGWGTYVTKSESVGKKYAVKSDKATGLKRSQLESNISRAEEQLSYLHGEVKVEKEKEIKEWKDNLANLDESRRLYTVEIPDDTGNNYIDENHTLQELKCGDMSERIDKAMDDYFGVKDSFYSWQKPYWAMREEFIRLAMGQHPEMRRGEADRKFSEVLSSAGVVGVHYDGRKDGDCYVIFDDKDLIIQDKMRFFHTPEGEAYGFTTGGKIYLDPDIATAETPIHEYTHLWAEALRRRNPEEWSNVVGLMKQCDTVWNDVRRNYPELTDDNDIADEVLATYSGRRGAERLRTLRDGILSGDSSEDEKKAATSAIDNLRALLSRIWKDIADFLHIHYTKPEEVADRVFGDLVSGFNPMKALDAGEGIQKAAEAPSVRYQFIGGDQIFLGYRNGYSADSDNEKESIDIINKHFNKELEDYEKGNVPFGTRFYLGMPSKELESVGFPYLPITMRASLLSKKAGMSRHPFEATELKGLVKAIQKPIAVFSYSKANMRNLIAGVKHNDKNFLVGITLDYKGGDIEVNSVSGLFPKESHEWVKWIQDKKALRIDQKKKVQDIIDSLRTNPAESERIGLNLSLVAKLVKDFENPVIKNENLSEDRINFSKTSARPEERANNDIVMANTENDKARQVQSSPESVQDLTGKETVKDIPRYADTEGAERINKFITDNGHPHRNAPDENGRVSYSMQVNFEDGSFLRRTTAPFGVDNFYLNFELSEPTAEGKAERSINFTVHPSELGKKGLLDDGKFNDAVTQMLRKIDSPILSNDKDKVKSDSATLSSLAGLIDRYVSDNGYVDANAVLPTKRVDYADGSFLRAVTQKDNTTLYMMNDARTGQLNSFLYPENPHSEKPDVAFMTEKFLNLTELPVQNDRSLPENARTMISYTNNEGRWHGEEQNEMRVYNEYGNILSYFSDHTSKARPLGPEDYVRGDNPTQSLMLSVWKKLNHYNSRTFIPEDKLRKLGISVNPMTKPLPLIKEDSHGRRIVNMYNIESTDFLQHPKDYPQTTRDYVNGLMRQSEHAFDGKYRTWDKLEDMVKSGSWRIPVEKDYGDDRLKEKGVSAAYDWTDKKILVRPLETEQPSYGGKRYMDILDSLSESALDRDNKLVEKGAVGDQNTVDVAHLMNAINYSIDLRDIPSEPDEKGQYVSPLITGSDLLRDENPQYVRDMLEKANKTAEAIQKRSLGLDDGLQATNTVTSDDDDDDRLDLRTTTPGMGDDDGDGISDDQENYAPSAKEDNRLKHKQEPTHRGFHF